MDTTYIYVTFNKEDFSVKYVGSGKGKRLDHVLSGRSSSAAANKAVLTSSGDFITVPFFTELPECAARDIEAGLIYALQPEWNKKGLGEQPNIQQDYLLDSLRVRAYMNLVRSSNIYDASAFERVVCGCKAVFVEADLPELSRDLISAYPYLNAISRIFIEKGEWLTFTN